MCLIIKSCVLFVMAWDAHFKINLKQKYFMTTQMRKELHRTLCALQQGVVWMYAHTRCR